MLTAFQLLAKSINNCHYYDGAASFLPTTPYYQGGNEIDEILKPSCDYTQSASIILLILGAVPLFGIGLLYKLKKRGLWLTLSIFATLLAASNALVYRGSNLSTCELYDEFSPYSKELFEPLGVTPFKYDTYRIQV